MQKITLLVDYGPNCRGETILVSDSGAAKMIARRIGVPAGSDARTPPPPKPVVDSPTSSKKPDDEVLDAGPESLDATESNLTTSSASSAALGQQSVFEFDGFKPEVAASLAAAGIRSAEDLRAYVTSGNDLTKLQHIGKKTATDLIECYVNELSI